MVFVDLVVSLYLSARGSGNIVQLDYNAEAQKLMGWLGISIYGHRYHDKALSIHKVGGLMILFTSGDRDRCDLTQESQYFDEKPESGGGSHEMMETKEFVLLMGKHSGQGIYGECGIYETSKLQMSNT